MARQLRLLNPLGPQIDIYRNLVGYWKLGEASGNRVDSSPSALSLTPINTPGNAAGKQGNGVLLASASSQRLNVASSSTIQRGSVDMAMACWVKFNTVATAGLMVKGNAFTDAGCEYALVYSGGIGARIGVSGAGARKSATSSLSISTGVWYFVVFWTDMAAGKMFIQINNGLVATATVGQFTPQSLTGDLNLGSSLTANYLDGILDEAALWIGRGLTTDERAWLYNQGSGRTLYP